MTERPTTGVTPFLTIRQRRGMEALDFYQRAFGATVTERNVAEDGQRLMQAGLRINGGWLMLSDEFPEWMGHDEPPPQGVTIHLQVDDADRWADRAVRAGATLTMPVGEQFWGDRYGQVVDPFGHRWSIGSPIR
ncbi:VOC family protein [Sphingomonas sp. KR1UV-12]|uniref:VOC family protein n=1 Tax=Sphingomonas aurea TaxID=3063994 RepID=A0ABT9ENZ3_9SPHN|nr:VOC family protein [Sphingomonas sp. KR1UV-12]MDP1028550.1 VOC family protein [Sphingomonas sp. KR1UV-12]